MSARLSEIAGIVYGAKPADVGSAGVDCTGFSLAKFRRSTTILQFGALTGDSELKVYAGATAAKTTAIAFKYRLAGAAQGSAGADQFGDRTELATADAATGLTLTAATYQNKLLLIEVDARDLPDGKPYVTVEIDADATAMNVAAVSILTDPRYSGDDVPTAL